MAFKLNAISYNRQEYSLPGSILTKQFSTLYEPGYNVTYRTNLPKEIMFFPDFPFPSHLPSYVTHQEVLQYLQDYTEHYKLRQFIKFGTLVEQVKPSLVNDYVTTEKVGKKSTCEGKDLHRFRDAVKWNVTSVDSETGKRTTEDYDAVLVCSG